jgi:hypothetical protein
MDPLNPKKKRQLKYRNLLMHSDRDGNDQFMPPLKREKSWIDLIVLKLTPKLLVFVLIVGLSLSTLVLGLTVYRGGTVQTSLFRLDTAGSQSAAILNLESENARLTEELQSKKPPGGPTNRGPSISLNQVNEILGEDLDSYQALERLRAMVQTERRMIDLESNFYYRLFLLEREIRKYGDFIATHIDRPERIGAYMLIQSVLEDLEFYEGEIDGDQGATAQALVRFQSDYNGLVEKAQRLTPLGYLGYRTLEALRSRYRSGEP